MFNHGAVYFHFRVVSSRTVPSGTLGRSLQLVVRRFILTAGQDNMRSGAIFNVKPVIEGLGFFVVRKSFCRLFFPINMVAPSQCKVSIFCANSFFNLSFPLAGSIPAARISALISANSSLVSIVCKAYSKDSI